MKKIKRKNEYIIGDVIILDILDKVDEIVEWINKDQLPRYLRQEEQDENLREMRGIQIKNCIIDIKQKINNVKETIDSWEEIISEKDT